MEECTKCFFVILHTAVVLIYYRYKSIIAPHMSHCTEPDSVFRSISLVFAFFERIGNMYCLEHTDIPEMFFTSHHELWRQQCDQQKNKCHKLGFSWSWVSCDVVTWSDFPYTVCRHIDSLWSNVPHPITCSPICGSRILDVPGAPDGWVPRGWRRPAHVEPHHLTVLVRQVPVALYGGRFQFFILGSLPIRGHLGGPAAGRRAERYAALCKSFSKIW